MFSKLFILGLLVIYIKAQQNQQIGFHLLRNVFRGSIGPRNGAHESPRYTNSYTGGLSLGGSDDSDSSESDAENENDGEDYYAPARYHFKYGVEDKHSGDIKEQEESRHGDVVKGYYTLHEPDGTILTVHYTADKHSGFNAKVHRSGHAHHPKYYYH